MVFSTLGMDEQLGYKRFQLEAFNRETWGQPLKGRRVNGMCQPRKWVNQSC
jgi:hypothetical protein